MTTKWEVGTLTSDYDEIWPGNWKLCDLASAVAILTLFCAEVILMVHGIWINALDNFQVQMTEAPNDHLENLSQQQVF